MLLAWGFASENQNLGFEPLKNGNSPGFRSPPISFFLTGFCQKFRMGIPPGQSWDWKLPKSSNKWNFTWPRLLDVRAVVFSDSYFRILPGHIRTHQDAVRLCPISARKKGYCKEWFNRMYLISSNVPGLPRLLKERLLGFDLCLGGNDLCLHPGPAGRCYSLVFEMDGNQIVELWWFRPFWPMWLCRGHSHQWRYWFITGI